MVWNVVITVGKVVYSLGNIVNIIDISGTRNVLYVTSKQEKVGKIFDFLLC